MVGAVLMGRMGALGMAWAMIGLEIAMIFQVWVAARRRGMVSRTKLRNAARAMVAELRARRTSLNDPNT